MIKINKSKIGNPNKVRLPRKVKKEFLKEWPRSEYYVRLDLSRNAFEHTGRKHYLNMHANDRH